MLNIYFDEQDKTWIDLLCVAGRVLAVSFVTIRIILSIVPIGEFCAEFSARCSRTTWCHTLAATFYSIGHIHTLVHHIRRDALFYLTKSALPWFILLRGILLCVYARTQLYFWFLFVTCHAVLLPAFAPSSDSSRILAFWGPDLFDFTPPRACRNFRKICDRRHHRTSAGRPAQGFSRTKLVTTTTSISSSAPAHPLEFRLSSLVLAWL